MEDYEQIVGPIQDFKSIRFIRLFMKGWEEEVVLRFAKMDLVRGDWRKYRLSMLEGTEGAGVGEITDAQLDINTVNIEENSSREPVNYILPPGITREISPNNQYLRQLNEQAISLKVTNLCDGDARAAYKNASLDVRQFERLQMFIHAEAIEGQILNDDDLCAFIRLGSDYKENYYEYEIPLKLTEPGFYNNETDNELVWIPENMLDIEFEVFQGVKQRRNEKIDEGGNIKLTSEYSEYINESGRRVSITGSPNLSNIRTIMIGVRNRKKESNILPDDALAKSIEIWMNELRLSGFKEQGGWATRGRLQANLADFSTIAIAGEYSTPGFGSIEKNVNERQQSTDMSYDFSTSAEIGKFFPKKYGVRIPVYVGYSEIISKPEYDPLNPDIKMAAVIKNMDQKERDRHLKISQDYLKRKTFNVTNIRINGNSEKKSKKDNKKKNIGENELEKNKGGRSKGGGTRSSKNKTPWHISNWSTSYGYNETFISNINTEHNILKIHTGAIAYNYNISPKNVKPFTKVKLFRIKPFRIIKDINFYYAPSLIAFRTDLRKSYNDIQLRNINDPTFILIPTFDKQFTWNRTYDLRYNLTRGLKLTYSANNQSWVDEPEGRIDKDDQDYKIYRNAVIDSLKNFGRTTDFHQKISGTWSIPINKLPLLDWTTANARYDADYYWTQNPIALNPDALPGEDTIIDLGNTIRNSQAFQISTQLNIERLYTKVKYLKSIDNQFKGKKKKKKKNFKDVSFTKENVKLKKDKARSITHNLRVEDVKLKVTGADGKEIEGKTEIVSENKVKFISENDVEDAKIEVTGKREIKENALKLITDYTLYTLMSVRNVSLTYSENNGTVLPGYMRNTKYFGCDESWKAPGWQFLLGIQDSLFAYNAQQHGWLTDDTLMTTPVIYTGDQTYDFKATLKPFTGLRIDVTANRRESYNESQLWTGDIDEPRSTYRTGDFSMSILTINTAFGKFTDSTYQTDVYTQFLNNRYKVAAALANERSIYDHNYIQDLLNNPDSVDDPVNDYPYGYKSTSKDVLTESFLAAYTGQDVGKFGRNPFPTIPMPNWRIKYDGLTYFDVIRKVFKKVIINHGYRSTYRVSSFNIDPEFDEYRIGTSAFSDATDSIFFVPEHQMEGVAIDEKFIPLIGIDVRWNNDMSTKLEYKQARALILSFANNQILETSSKEYVVGFGYKIPDLNIPMTIQGNQKLFKSDLNIRVDFTYRDMMTVIRRINEEDNQLSAGNNNISIKVNADYNLDKVTFRIFYDRIMNKPRVSTAYKTTNTHIGFSLRFNLSNI
ncbi:MAG: cell surface protein SprA [Bacteroidales bacterium]|nr:cell surface protein SprA [Bacteroidales bacterium]